MYRKTLAHALGLLTPLALAACATQLPDASTNHPANPGAAQAAPTAPSTTLNYTPDTAASPAAMDPGMKMDPNVKMEGTPGGAAAPADPHAGHDMKAMDLQTPQKGTEGKMEGATDVQSADPYYTCPMHPEVKQPGPGICPICEMKLVKKTPKANPKMKMEGMQ